MKISALVLASLALSSVASAYEYQGPVTNFPPTTLVGTPFAVANAAYNSQLDGIPGFNSFCSGLISGSITADEVVAQAQAQGLTKGTVDAAYVRKVASQMDGICHD
jgi:hypothetical protein